MTWWGRGVPRHRVVPWWEVKLLLLLLLLLLLRCCGGTFWGPDSSNGPHGPGRSTCHVLSHQHDFLLEKLALPVLDAVKLPLTLGQHLGIQWRLLRKTTSKKEHVTENKEGMIHRVSNGHLCICMFSVPLSDMFTTWRSIEKQFNKRSEKKKEQTNNQG